MKKHGAECLVGSAKCCLRTAEAALRGGGEGRLRGGEGALRTGEGGLRSGEGSLPGAEACLPAAAEGCLPTAEGALSTKIWHSDGEASEVCLRGGEATSDKGARRRGGARIFWVSGAARNSRGASCRRVLASYRIYGIL